MAIISYNLGPFGQTFKIKIPILSSYICKYFFNILEVLTKTIN